MEKCKIRINDFDIVVELNDNKDFGIPDEVCVYAKGKDFIQDICVIREHYDIENKQIKKNNEDIVDCLVWSDEKEEDYTHKFTIKIDKELT